MICGPPGDASGSRLRNPSSSLVNSGAICVGYHLDTHLRQEEKSGWLRKGSGSTFPGIHKVLEIISCCVS
jgi:hypothetical protein